jgi:DNA-binding IclR family transcriptional regulator
VVYSAAMNDQPSEPVRRESRGIKSIEVGYSVLLAVQRGPGAVQLAEIAKRAGLSSGAAHNYISSLVRTGLVEQDGRGLYRLGPSAFALSLNSFRQLNGLEVMRSEAENLHRQTGQSTTIAVWSQAGPISVFTQRAESMGSLEFRPGRVTMMSSGAGMVYAGYLSEADLLEPINYEFSQGASSDLTAEAFIAHAQSEVVPRGYGFYRRMEDSFFVLAAPVWSEDDRIPFVVSVLARDPDTDPGRNRAHLDALLAACGRATTLLAGTMARGPRARRRR